MDRVNPFSDIYRQCNIGTNEEKYVEISEKIRLGEKVLPKYIDIELTNKCNFRCLMCPTGTSAMKRKSGYMSMETVDRICEEITKNPMGVRLIRWGEPTLHKDFVEILKKIKITGNPVHFNTNGSLLSFDILKEIVEMQIDSIKFSFQGTDNETYGEMRNGGDFNRLLKTLNTLYQLRGDLPYPYIQVSTTTTYETEEQIEKFISIIKPLCDYYNVGRTVFSHLNVDEMKISKEEKERILLLKERENLQKKYISVCPEIYDKLSINWDGTVVGCCSDYNNLMVVGNIMENSIEEIFKNQKICEFREIISKQNYAAIDLCSKCYEYI